MRYILSVSIALGLGLLYLLSLASANTAISGEYYRILLYLNIGLAGVLIALICVQIWNLIKKVRQEIVGSRLNLRLVQTFALMAVIPGLLVYLVSVNFLSRSIESWFNVKVESALDGGLSLGQRALDNMLKETEQKAENIAATLAFQTGKTSYSVLNDLREKSGVQEAALLSAHGKILQTSSNDASSFLPDLPSIPQLRQAQKSVYGKIEPVMGKGLYLRVLAPVISQELSGETRILQLMQPVPKSLSNTAEAVQEVYRDYQELSYSRKSLREVFTLTLTLVLLLAMLSALGIAFLISRRLSQPLAVLAEGTREIASGNYSHRLPEKANDELGVLVKSFNSMTRQLDDATKAGERNRERLESARAYLETILAHLSSGVLVLNNQGEIRSINRAASTILGFDLTGFEGQLFDHLSKRKASLTDFVSIIKTHFEGSKQDNNAELNRQVELMSPNGKLILLVRGTRMPANADRGYILVFDDVTNLVQNQRVAAWGEVARRLAHEIKNPLTPIQLSAERLQYKFANKLAAADASMLKRATDTIVTQVGAMKTMVNEFSIYARAPSATMSKLKLNALIRDVAIMYEGAHAKVNLNLENNLPEILGDETMLRQILHNLLKNAQDALENTANAEIWVMTSAENNTVTLTVSDNGTGFPDTLIGRAFEPYVTTKTHGTGLGLAIVKKMVEEHEGQIKIENGATGGARITVQLPAIN